MKIGFIGIGVMGQSMVRNLMKKGYDVSVYNRTKAKADAVVQEGAHWCDSPGACAADKDVVITIVGYPKDVEEVYAYHWPDPEELYDPDLAVPLVKSLYQDTDFALTTQFGGHLFEMGQFLLGFEDYLAYLYTEPEIAEAIMDKTREIQMKVETLVLRTIGDLLVFMKVSSYWSSLVQGVLLILAVAASAYGTMLKRRGGAAA